MIVALYIFLALVVVGGVLYALHRYGEAHPSANAAKAPSQPVEPEEECCGMHVTCERDSLLAAVSKDIEYYDDEELDAYKGVDPADYTPEQVEQFRDVLLTLLPDDIAGWARSIQLRGIQLPLEVKDELIMIVAEERQKRAAAPSHS